MAKVNLRPVEHYERTSNFVKTVTSHTEKKNHLKPSFIARF